MKKNYVPLFKAVAVIAIMLCSQFASSQVALHMLEGIGQALTDINDSGKATQNGGIYDFASDAVTPADAEVYGLSGINNNGDLIGTMPYTFEGQDLTQPGYKKDGVWHPMGQLFGANADASFSLGQISENGLYIGGQISPDCCNFQAFLYNTASGTYEILADPGNEYGAGYTVNNDGKVGGWYDPQPEGTLRVPAYMTTGSVITKVPPGQVEAEGQIGAISNNNIMVGDRNGVPFMFDQVNNTYTEFTVPAPYETATFTSVSDTGVAIGYAQIWQPDGPIRDAIIYHPNLGAQPILIAEILNAHGIDITTFDGKLGTAIAISPDGNYVCGWDNSFFFFAAGWAINFDDMLMSSCYIICPQDVVAVNPDGGPKVVDYTLAVNCSENPNTSTVLVSGLASGSSFPLGTTEVVHNLVDENGSVINTCTFNVTVTEEYCTPEDFETVEPITRVNIANINNASDANSPASYEDFTTITGTVNRGETYPTALEGYTGGPYADLFTAYIDWNRDGNFDASETYALGMIADSTGEDGQQAISSIVVPNDAALGATMMRIAKTYDVGSVSACDPGSGFGQVEDYTLMVEEALATKNFSRETFEFYPNPAREILYVSNATVIETVTLYNMLGQEVLVKAIGSHSGQISLSGLSAGNYVVKATTTNAVKTFKISKQ